VKLVGKKGKILKIGKVKNVLRMQLLIEKSLGLSMLDR
jgi:hypothetical protein